MPDQGQNIKGLAFVALGVTSAVNAALGLTGPASQLYDFFDQNLAKVGAPPGTSLWIVSGSLLVAAAYFFYLWRSRHSVLLRPQALTLRRSSTEHLVGREADLDRLSTECASKQIVFLEGESGSGKSALIRAGLMPQLEAGKLFAPVLLPDGWVDDWDRGPISGLVQALRLMAPEGTMKDGKDARAALLAIADTTHRKPLVVFDQFDDYVSQHQAKFTPDKVWLSSSQLKEANEFWKQIGEAVRADEIVLLFAVRSDAAASLDSVRFAENTATCRLEKVRKDYVLALINQLATSTDTNSPVIDQPEAGWNQLVPVLVNDLSEDGVILPQRLKLVLNSLGTLRWLSPYEYYKVGRTGGLETSLVESVIATVSRKTGTPPEVCRAILVSLVDPENRSRTRPLSLNEILDRVHALDPAVDGHALQAVLDEFENSELIRQVVSAASANSVYRLDHDYLARPVWAAERRANRWLYYLSEARARANQAVGLGARWASLLTPTEQIRLLVARMGGQFRYSENAPFAILSTLRFIPAVAALTVAATALVWWLGWSDAQTATDRASVLWKKIELASAAGNVRMLSALDDLSTSPVSVRTAFASALFNHPEEATTFLKTPRSIAHALVGLDDSLRDQLEREVKATTQKSDPANQIAASVLASDYFPELITTSSLLDALAMATTDAEITALTTAIEMLLSTPRDDEAVSLTKALALYRDQHDKPDLNAQSKSDAALTALQKLAGRVPSTDALAAIQQIESLEEADKSEVTSDDLVNIIAELLLRLDTPDHAAALRALTGEHASATALMAVAGAAKSLSSLEAEAAFVSLVKNTPSTPELVQALDALLPAVARSVFLDNLEPFLAASTSRGAPTDLEGTPLTIPADVDEPSAVDALRRTIDFAAKPDHHGAWAVALALAQRLTSQDDATVLLANATTTLAASAGGINLSDVLDLDRSFGALAQKADCKSNLQLAKDMNRISLYTTSGYYSVISCLSPPDRMALSAELAKDPAFMKVGASAIAIISGDVRRLREIFPIQSDTNIAFLLLLLSIEVHPKTLPSLLDGILEIASSIDQNDKENLFSSILEIGRIRPRDSREWNYSLLVSKAILAKSSEDEQLSLLKYYLKDVPQTLPGGLMAAAQDPREDPESFTTFLSAMLENIGPDTCGILLGEMLNSPLWDTTTSQAAADAFALIARAALEQLPQGVRATRIQAFVDHVVAFHEPKSVDLWTNAIALSFANILSERQARLLFDNLRNTTDTNLSEAATWLHSLLSDEERASVLDRLDHYPGKGSKLVEGLSDEARLQAIAEIVKETSARKAPGRSRIPLAVGVASSISDAKIKAAQALTLLAIPSLTEDELTSISALDLDGATNGSLPIWTLVKNARLESKSP